ncbi:MAG: peptidoglycan DD-metalloendopeptidase family protein [Nevskia sp.]|nr:peptidoglycan DD-metalloendopeptidase family protein [Nevskia sp.]
MLSACLGACATHGRQESGSSGSHRATRTAAGSGLGDYRVQRGDTLYSIAFRHQLDYHDIANWNGIGRDYAIYPGQILHLHPAGGDSRLQPVASARPAPVPAASVPEAPTTAVAVAAPRPAPQAGADPPDLPGPGFDSGRWEWPTRGKVARGFEADSSKGLDIAGDYGQIVVAAAGGKVVYSGSALKGYGELVIIKHDEQYLSAYGYNRRRLVEEGQQVVAGEPIAELGMGPEQKPLLHFEIRDKGRPVDPLPLLPKR